MAVNNCPVCLSEHIGRQVIGSEATIYCLSCGMKGPMVPGNNSCDARDKAGAIWNRLAVGEVMVPEDPDFRMVNAAITSSPAIEASGITREEMAKAIRLANSVGGVK